MATQTPELPTPPLAGADPMAQTLALLQPWIDYVPKQQRRLGIFIFLALLAHVTVFFFIRIDTTRAELRRQPHTHVTVENDPNASQEAQAADNFWDRLTDPRLFLLPITPSASPSSSEPVFNFSAINSSIGSDQPPAPALAGDYEFIHQVVSPLDQRVATAMTPARQPFNYDEAPRPIAAVTTWQWEKSLAQRQPTGMPDLPSPVSDTDLTPTELNVAVDAEGTVQHVLVAQGCGKLELDQQAVLAARKIRFKPGPGDAGDILWGRVTIFWHYAAQPREEVVPTPLSPP